MLSFDTPLQPILPGFIVRHWPNFGGLRGDKVTINKGNPAPPPTQRKTTENLCHNPRLLQITSMVGYGQHMG
jgi:hypothetical protein